MIAVQLGVLPAFAQKDVLKFSKDSSEAFCLIQVNVEVHLQLIHLFSIVKELL